MKKSLCAGLRQAIFSRGFVISAVGTSEVATHSPIFAIMMILLWVKGYWQVIKTVLKMSTCKNTMIG